MADNNESKFPLLITVVLIVIIASTIRSIFDLRVSINRLDNAKEDVEQLRQENSDLNEKIEYVQTNEYLEKAALEELNLTKPGNRVLIIDENQPKYGENAPKPDIAVEKKENWQLWLQEFNL